MLLAAQEQVADRVVQPHQADPRSHQYRRRLLSVYRVGDHLERPRKAKRCSWCLSDAVVRLI